MTLVPALLLAFALGGAAHGSTADVVGERLLSQRRMLPSATVVVTGVADGDTFYGAMDGSNRSFRLAEVDAPEKKQPFGARAEQSLRELVGKRSVQVTVQDVDRYGRFVVRVEVDGVDVAQEQVRRGMAWVFRQYARSPGLFVLEAQARAAQRGLWADPLPVAPWDWRKRSHL